MRLMELGIPMVLALNMMDEVGQMEALSGSMSWRDPGYRLFQSQQ